MFWKQRNIWNSKIFPNKRLDLYLILKDQTKVCNWRADWEVAHVPLSQGVWDRLHRQETSSFCKLICKPCHWQESVFELMITWHICNYTINMSSLAIHSQIISPPGTNIWFAVHKRKYLQFTRENICSSQGRRRGDLLACCTASSFQKDLMSKFAGMGMF